MSDEMWTLEVLIGEKVVDGPAVVGASLDGAKELARERMTSLIDLGRPGDSVRLLAGGKEVYRWTLQDDALARAHAGHKEARRPGRPHP